MSCTPTSVETSSHSCFPSFYFSFRALNLLVSCFLSYFARNIVICFILMDKRNSPERTGRECFFFIRTPAHEKVPRVAAAAAAAAANIFQVTT